MAVLRRVSAVIGTIRVVALTVCVIISRLILCVAANESSVNMRSSNVAVTDCTISVTALSAQNDKTLLSKPINSAQEEQFQHTHMLCISVVQYLVAMRCVAVIRLHRTCILACT
jgi:hypothetical protein